MPNLSGMPALDVVIGLAFLFFLLATACSAINEMIASALGWRAKTLEDGVRSLLGEPQIRVRLRVDAKAWLREVIGLMPGKRDGQAPPEPAEEPPARATAPAGTEAPGAHDDLTTAVFEHWSIQSLVRDPASQLRRRCRPSYLPPSAFSQAVVEQLARLAPAGNPEPTAWDVADKALYAKVEQALAGPAWPASPVLKKAAADAFGNVEMFRKNVEGAFDDAMTRAQGWYKRKVQAMVLVLALVLAVGLNVDAVHIGTRLWKDPALRSAVAARAGQANEDAATVADAVDQVNQLDLPLGWGAENAPSGALGPLSSVPGWIVTIAALSLGAPFWFDVLSRLARLRGAGGTDEGRALSDKQASKTS